MNPVLGTLAQQLEAGQLEADEQIQEAIVDVQTVAVASDSHAYRFEQLSDGSVVQIRVDGPGEAVQLTAL